MQNEIIAMLKRHEGLKLFPYKCSKNFLTLGVGRNLETNGITEEEANYLLFNDIKRVKEQLKKNFGVYRTFPKRARLVCIDMAFQMGIKGFMSFRNTRELMVLGKWVDASEELLRSKYAILDTPNRALYNSRQLALCQNDKKNQRTAPK
jgi:lysozyme